MRPQASGTARQRQRGEGGFCWATGGMEQQQQKAREKGSASPSGYVATSLIECRRLGTWDGAGGVVNMHLHPPREKKQPTRLTGWRDSSSSDPAEMLR
jgi:hypothetical protein